MSECGADRASLRLDLRRRLLSAARRSLAVAQAWILLWRIAWLLGRGISLPEVRRRLTPARNRHRGSASPARWQRIVALAARFHPCRPVCLEQSICLESLLARAGHAATFHIGVRRRGGVLEAHAWVEEGGRSVGGEPVDRTSFLPLMPAAGAERSSM